MDERDRRSNFLNKQINGIMDERTEEALELHGYVEATAQDRNEWFSSPLIDRKILPFFDKHKQKTSDNSKQSEEGGYL